MSISGKTNWHANQDLWKLKRLLGEYPINVNTAKGRYNLLKQIRDIAKSAIDEIEADIASRSGVDDVAVD